MSTLRCDNFGPSAGGTTYSARGIAKAWVNFDGTGTIAARDSENVSSLTDGAVGVYTVNFNSAFSAGDYSHVFSSHKDGTATGALMSVNTYNTSNSQLIMRDTSENGQDCDYVAATAHGDLA